MGPGEGEKNLASASLKVDLAQYDLKGGVRAGSRHPDQGPQVPFHILQLDHICIGKICCPGLHYVGCAEGEVRGHAGQVQGGPGVIPGVNPVQTVRLLVIVIRKDHD